MLGFSPDIIILIDDGENTMGYMAKGHHSLEEMVKAIRYSENEEFEFNPKFHTYVKGRFKPVPVNRHEQEFTGFTHRITEVDKPMRGAYLATIIYL